MTAQELRDWFAFDDSLAVGQTVEIRWTNNYRQYVANARIVKLNAKTLRAELLEQAQREDYRPGRVIAGVPRFRNDAWTNSNGVFPAQGKG